MGLTPSNSLFSAHVSGVFYEGDGRQNGEDTVFGRADCVCPEASGVRCVGLQNFHQNAR